MRNELDIQTLQRAKANAVAYFHANDTDHEFWEQCVEDIDDEIKCIGKEPDLKPARSRIKTTIWAVTIFVFVMLIYLCVGCNAVSGLGRDVTAISDGYMEMMSKE
jgi:predicted small secreted protein